MYLKPKWSAFKLTKNQQATQDFKIWTCEYLRKFMENFVFQDCGRKSSGYNMPHTDYEFQCATLK